MQRIVVDFKRVDATTASSIRMQWLRLHHKPDRYEKNLFDQHVGGGVPAW